jgi:histidinol-phosphate aminotransferase
MTLSRRSFTRMLGLTSAGLAAAPFVAARGREAFAAELWNDPHTDPAAFLSDGASDIIRLSSNENPRGPSQAALQGIQAALGFASRYPSGTPTDLRTSIADTLGVERNQVLVGCGSAEILRIAVDAFTGPGRALVTAAPTFEDAGRRAERTGVPVRALPVDKELRLDLDAMAEASAGAGLVFLCNPNNPTGTVHGAAAVRRFVRQVHERSPGTLVLVDEAYHEYVNDPEYETSIPLALADPRVMVVRTFSKAYGIAGLRVGYAVAQAETLAALTPFALGNGVNVIGAAAAAAALTDRALAERERELNNEALRYTAHYFQRAGYAMTDSQANFIMVDVRRPAREFQLACRERAVHVGRAFPPLTSWSRISIGTMDEMRAAVEVFRSVLG